MLKYLRKIICFLIIINVLFAVAGCEINGDDNRTTDNITKLTEDNKYYEKNDQEYELKSINIYTYFIDVADDLIEYYGAISKTVYKFSSYDYKISDNIIYISLKGTVIENFTEKTPNKINIKIQDDRIRKVNKVVVGAEYDTYKQVIWDRENGFLGLNGGMGANMTVTSMTNSFVYVKDDCIEYGGYVMSDIWGFSGYSYKILENILYIHPEINDGDYFNTWKCWLHIVIQDDNIRNINTIILGKEDDKNKKIIWDRENGFHGPEFHAEEYNEAQRKYWLEYFGIEPYFTD